VVCDDVLVVVVIVVAVDDGWIVVLEVDETDDIVDVSIAIEVDFGVVIVDADVTTAADVRGMGVGGSGVCGIDCIRSESCKASDQWLVFHIAKPPILLPLTEYVRMAPVSKRLYHQK
jgi:hypothetical protein